MKSIEKIGEALFDALKTADNGRNRTVLEHLADGGRYDRQAKAIANFQFKQKEAD